MGLFRKYYNRTGNGLISRYVRFRSSIYGRVVMIITLLSIFLFTIFSIIFKSVNDEYLNTLIRQHGSNISSIVEGALYHSMLANDKGSLQRTLDIINTLPGIDEVNMYDSEDNLVYSTIASDTNNSHGNPDCISCHKSIRSKLPGQGTSYRIINVGNDCRMVNKDRNSRHLLIRSPILNEPSCYSAACHAHKPTDTLLGSLIINLPLDELDRALSRSSLEFFALALLTTFLLAAFLILFTRRKIKEPLNKLVEVSVAVANGDRSTRVEVKSNQLDDMRMVSDAFNNMLDNLQAATDELQNWSQQLEYKVQKKSEELATAQGELMHVERLAALGKLSSSVAHEINNPLSGILVYTKLLTRQLGNRDLDDARRESMLRNLQFIENETKRCGEIVKGLLEFSRRDQEDFETVHLHKVLQSTYDLMAHPVQIANIRFTTGFSAENDLVRCSPNQVKQAVVALIVNASEAVTENGEILIRTSNPDPDNILVEISDNGVGISPEDLPHIFEPFFSTKQNTSGIGLGLAIVHGIVQNHKGKIQVKSDPGNGTTISWILPLVKT